MAISIPLDQMTTAEKLQAMEALWDDLCRTEAAELTPDWHQPILEKRQHLVETNDTSFTDWELAKKALQDSLK